jgi:multiple sugar transport system ATP-binding protein
MVFQSYALYPHMTVYKNIAFPLKAQGVLRADIPKKVEWAAGLFGIGRLLHRKPRQLSGGERQRVAVARALAHHPKLIVADEPTGSLDAETGSHVLELVQRLRERHGMTVVLVTNDEDVARLADRNLRLRDGLIAAGAPRPARV